MHCYLKDIKKRGHLYRLSSFQVVGNPRWNNCTERPRLRLLYTTPIRVWNKYTRAQTFTSQYLHLIQISYVWKLKIMFVNVFHVPRHLVCRLRLADGYDTIMSEEDMRQATNLLRCKVTAFLWESDCSSNLFFILSYFFVVGKKDVRTIKPIRGSG